MKFIIIVSAGRR